MAIDKYPTYADYPNQTGFNQIVYPIRDSIIIINPFFIILFGLLLILTVSSYYIYNSLSGKTRIFNSILASSFVTTVISFFFALAGWIDTSHVLTFIGITIVSIFMVIFYR
jgi:hypothetical protein